MVTAMHKAIPKIAAELGVKAGAFAKWRQRGAVPYNWHLKVLDAAHRQGILLSAADLTFPPSSRPVDKSSEGKAA